MPPLNKVRRQGCSYRTRAVITLGRENYMVAGAARCYVALGPAAPLIRSASFELGTRLPEGDELLRAYLPAVCRAVPRGEVSVEAATEMIHRHVVSPLGHPSDLMVWCYLASDLLERDGKFQEATHDDVLAEARRWAAEPCAAADTGPE